MDAVRRPLTQPELSAIGWRMGKVRRTHGSAFSSLGSAAPVLENLLALSARGRVVVFTEAGSLVGILVFDVGSLWWTTETVLIEEFVLVVQDGFHGFQRIAIQELERLAKEYDVAAILAGSLYTDEPRMVLNAYKKAGFTETAPTCIKVLRGAGKEEPHAERL